MSKLNYIVIIPARGGSKTIKNKNLQKINNKSLIQIGVEKFKELENISNIVITSDDDEILNEATKFGAIAWKRPEELSGDTATSESALKEVLDNCKLLNTEDHLIFHQCTSPLLSVNSIKQALIKFENTNASCVFSVQEEFNPIWSVDDKNIKILNTEDLNRKGRQKRKPMLIETGGIYVINRTSFNENYNRFGENPKAITIPKIESIDIDEETDLFIATRLNQI